MLKDIKSIASRSGETILQDLAGAMALVLMLIAGLHLPGFV